MVPPRGYKHGSPWSVHTPDEPIAKAVGDAWTRFAQWWNHGPVTTPLKIAILIVAAFVAVFYGGWLAPAAAVLGAVYLLYLGIRVVSQAMNAPSGPLPLGDGRGDGLPTSHNHYRSAGWNHLSWEQQGRQFLRMKTAGDRVGELTGSMLSAALIAGVLTVVMATLGGPALYDSANQYAGPGWLWLAMTLGSWLVLGTGNSWKPRPARWSNAGS